MERGYFYTEIVLSDYNQVFDVLIDTGSQITIVPDASCKECGLHTHPPYRLSPTAVRHNSKLGRGKDQSRRGNKGYFSQWYTEGSMVEGEYIDEQATLQYLSDVPEDSKNLYGSAKIKSRLVKHTLNNIGLIQKETSLIKSQKCDGLLGIRNNESGQGFSASLGQYLEDHKIFLCLDSHSPFLFYGNLFNSMASSYYNSITAEPILKADTKHDHHYTMWAITDNDSKASINLSRFYAMFDSGTTFSVLPNEVYEFIISLFLPQLQSLGYYATYDRNSRLCVPTSLLRKIHLPEFSLYFQSAPLEPLTWTHDQYLFASKLLYRNRWTECKCLSIMSDKNTLSRQIILGGSFLMHSMIEMNYEKRTIRRYVGSTGSSICSTIMGEHNIPIVTVAQAKDAMPTSSWYKLPVAILLITSGSSILFKRKGALRRAVDDHN